MARALALLIAMATTAAATPTIRLATIVPDGTPWSRELQHWADAVSAQSGGKVAVKLYFGGIAKKLLDPKLVPDVLGMLADLRAMTRKK